MSSLLVGMLVSEGGIWETYLLWRLFLALLLDLYVLSGARTDAGWCGGCIQRMRAARIGPELRPLLGET